MKKEMVFVVLLLNCIVRADTHTAASCSQTDVQAAITAASTGDIVAIPAGTATWGSGGSSIDVNKAITLQGAGRNATIIDISAAAGSWGNGTVRISAAATVKSFTIRTPTSGGTGTAFSMFAYGRITDVTYLQQTSTVNGYFLYAGSYGLVDNCDITGSSGDMELIFARGPTDSWQTGNSIGGIDNLFVENCTFGGSGYVCDCNSNSRGVLRYNTIKGQMKIDGHGKCTNTPPRSVRHMEIYNNKWVSDGYFAAIEFRGGTGRIFNNEWSGTSGLAYLTITDYACQQTNCNGYPGKCGCPADYPLDDQIGVGKDPKSAASEPLYLWGNKSNAGRWSAFLPTAQIAPCQSANTCGASFTLDQVIHPNRDFYDSATKPGAMSGYTPYTCPHPMVGTGTCLESVAGTAGYVVNETKTAPRILRVANCFNIGSLAATTYGVSYTLGSNENVDLSVYDITGRHIRTLVNGYRQAGKYSATWNSKGYASVIFLFRLVVGKAAVMRKATIIK